MPETHELLTRARIATIYDDARPNFPGVDFHPFSKLNEPNAAFMDSFARAAYAKGLTAARESEREDEFVKLAEAAHVGLQGTSFSYEGSPGVARLVIARVFPEDHAALLAFKYFQRAHPLPPRECVRCALCDQSGADLSTGVHATYDECIEALGAALKSFAAGVGR